MNTQSTARPASPPRFEPRELRKAFGQFATGVTIVTTQSPSGQMIGLTVNSFSSLSIDPPLVLWSLAKRSPNLQVFCEATHFCINVLAHDQHAIASQFATPAPDKFAGVKVEPGQTGMPLLANTVAHFECSRSEVHDGGDHLIFIGEVEQFRIFERPPLLFHGGAFQQLASAVAESQH
jgi:flavin reductase (DIM6/NTAB) family NADH-FMN oxidoreductase RutF